MKKWLGAIAGIFFAASASAQTTRAPVQFSSFADQLARSPVATTPQPTDQLYIRQAAVSKQVPISALYAGITTNLTTTTNTWVLQNFNGGMGCNITTQPTTQCLAFNQNSPGGTYNTATNLNRLTLTESIVGTTFFLQGWSFEEVSVASGAGGRTTLAVTSTVNGWSALGGNAFYTTLLLNLNVTANAGGTAISPAGFMNAFNPVAQATSAATYLTELFVDEHDIRFSGTVGTAPLYLTGLKIVQLCDASTCHSAHGRTAEGAIVFTNQSNGGTIPSGWNILIGAGTYNGGVSPFGSNIAANGATYIGLYGSVGFKYGVDFLNATPQGTDQSAGFAFRSPGYTIAWNGALTAAALSSQSLAIGGFSITGSGTGAFVSITGTWNTTGVVDAALLVNITNTASGAASKLFDLQIASSSLFSIDKSGNVIAVGTLNADGLAYPTSLTSGGVLYASSATAIASSALLGANCIVYGGGAGIAPATSSSTCPTVSSAGLTTVPNTTGVTVNGGFTALTGAAFIVGTLANGVGIGAGNIVAIGTSYFFGQVTANTSVGAVVLGPSSGAGAGIGSVLNIQNGSGNNVFAHGNRSATLGTTPYDAAPTIYGGGSACGAPCNFYVYVNVSTAANYSALWSTSATAATSTTTGTYQVLGGIAASMASWIGGNLTISAGANTNAILGESSNATNYNMLTMNGSLSSVTGIGFIGGKTSGGTDNNLTLTVPTGGGYNFNINGSTLAAISTAGALQATLAAATGTNAVCNTPGTNTALTVQVWATGCAASSADYKQNIREIDPALAFAIVMNMRAVQYEYRPSAKMGNDEHVGFTAEQIASITEKIDSYDMITYRADGKPHAVKYNEMAPLFAAAIQALKADNDNLRVEIEILKKGVHR